MSVVLMCFSEESKSLTGGDWGCFHMNNFSASHSSQRPLWYPLVIFVSAPLSVSQWWKTPKKLIDLRGEYWKDVSLIVLLRKLIYLVRKPKISLFTSIFARKIHKFCEQPEENAILLSVLLRKLINLMRNTPRRTRQTSDVWGGHSNTWPPEPLCGILTIVVLLVVRQDAAVGTARLKLGLVWRHPYESK